MEEAAIDIKWKKSMGITGRLFKKQRRAFVFNSRSFTWNDGARHSFDELYDKVTKMNNRLFMNFKRLLKDLNTYLSK
ncbi:hypothetical protein AAAC51_17380 [Priestia megaterium]